MHAPVVRTTLLAFPASALLSFALAHSNGAVSALSSNPAPAAAGTPASLYFGDIDADGLDDALAINARGAVTLLSNRGEGRFEDITLASGLAALEGASCALFADFDGDGDADLFVGSSEKRLWLNLGNASFEPLESGIDHDLIDLAAGVVDHDQDGQLDLHVHTEAGDLLYRNAGRGSFERVEIGDLGGAASALSVTGSDAELDNAGAPIDESPSRRRLRRWGARGFAGAANAFTPPGPVGATPVPSPSPGLPVSLCLPTIANQAGGSCLSASTTPTLGMLYPLSTNFSVSASGNIGMGTTTPTGNLDVIRPSARVRLSGADGETSTVSLLENNVETAGFDMRYDGTNNRFQISARDGAATLDPAITINRSNTNVGIGTITPAQKLDVAGNALVSGSVTGNTLVSTVATGTAPLTVASTTKVTNLNADTLDGFDSSAFTQLGNTIESAEITDGTIATADLSANSVTSANIVNSTIAMVDLAQNGASTGQIIKWNGSAWAPATDAIGSGSQYLTLGPGAFKSDDSNLRIVNNVFDGVWATGGTWIVAPVNLPADAQVLSVKAYVNDTQIGANLNVNMLEKDNLSANSFYVGSPIIAFEVLAGASGFFNQTFPVTNGFISGDSAYYVLVAPTPAGWPGNGTLAVQNIVIEWKLP